MMKPQIPPASGADGAGADSRQLAAISERAKGYARNSRAENTQRAYETDWRQFSSWLRRQAFAVSPPDPRPVGLYLAACAYGTGRMTPVSVATLERRLSGIAWHYRQLGEPLDTLAAGTRDDLTEGERKLAFSGHSPRAGLASSARIEEAHLQRHLGHASAL